MKRKAVVAGAVAGSALLATSIFAGCVAFNRPVALYGPPSDRNTTPRRTVSPDVNYDEDDYDPPLILKTPAPTVSFDPDENMPETVYGPPSYFGFDDPDEDFDPDENIPAPVYGPAPWYEDESVETPAESAAPEEETQG